VAAAPEAGLLRIAAKRDHLLEKMRIKLQDEGTQEMGSGSTQSKKRGWVAACAGVAFVILAVVASGEKAEAMQPCEPGEMRGYRLQELTVNGETVEEGLDAYEDSWGIAMSVDSIGEDPVQVELHTSGWIDDLVAELEP